MSDEELQGLQAEFAQLRAEADDVVERVADVEEGRHPAWALTGGRSAG